MKNALAIFAVLTVAVPCSAKPVSNKAVGFGNLVSTLGDWTIYRKIYADTDKITCTALYKGAAEIKLTSNALSVDLSSHGHVVGYRVWADDELVTDVQLPDENSERVETFVLRDAMFQMITSAHHLRVEISPHRRAPINENLDLIDMPRAILYLSSPGCSH